MSNFSYILPRPLDLPLIHLITELYNCSLKHSKADGEFNRKQITFRNVLVQTCNQLIQISKAFYNF